MKCFSDKSNFMYRVYAISFAPLFLALLNYVIYLIRLHRPCYGGGGKRVNYNETLSDKRSQLLSSTTTSGIANRAKRTSLFSDIMTAAFGRRHSEVANTTAGSNNNDIISPSGSTNDQMSNVTMSPLSLHSNNGKNDNMMYEFPRHIGGVNSAGGNGDSISKSSVPTSNVSSFSTTRIGVEGGLNPSMSSMDLWKAKLHDENRARRVANEHINFVLLLSYLVLPHVALIQFSALGLVLFVYFYLFL